MSDNNSRKIITKFFIPSILFFFIFVILNYINNFVANSYLKVSAIAFLVASIVLFIISIVLFKRSNDLAINERKKQDNAKIQNIKEFRETKGNSLQ